MIIRRFDENISQKASKNQVVSLQETMQNDYAKLADLEEMQTSTVKQLGDWSVKLTEQQQMLEMLSKTLKQ